VIIGSDRVVSLSSPHAEVVRIGRQRGINQELWWIPGSLAVNLRCSKPDAWGTTPAWWS